MTFFRISKELMSSTFMCGLLYVDSKKQMEFLDKALDYDKTDLIRKKMILAYAAVASRECLIGLFNLIFYCKISSSELQEIIEVVIDINPIGKDCFLDYMIKNVKEKNLLVIGR